MGLKVWYYKKFRKDDVVRAYVAHPDKRLRVRYIIPKNNVLSMPEGKYLIDADDYILEKGIPTYFFNTERSEPINILKQTQTAYPPEKFRTAIDNKIADELFRSQEAQTDLPYALIIFGGVIVASIAVATFVLYSHLETIIEGLKGTGVL